MISLPLLWDRCIDTKLKVILQFLAAGMYFKHDSWFPLLEGSKTSSILTFLHIYVAQFLSGRW